MPSKRASTVRVEYVTVFCTHRPSLFPILTFDIMLTTCEMVHAFKLKCGEEGTRPIESLILVKRVYFCMSDIFCLINIRVLFYLYISMRAIKSFYSKIIPIRNLVDCVI